LGIGDWAQSPIPNPLLCLLRLNNLSEILILIIIKIYSII